MSLYPVVAGAGDDFAEDGLMVAFRLEDVASPLRDGRPLAPGSASRSRETGTSTQTPKPHGILRRVRGKESPSVGGDD
ncbi:MAG TPA: hypothetical protein VHZ03_52720 [Trebonia sp.]|nr:hypothetical protein [Trebonia sp.]